LVAYVGEDMCFECGESRTYGADHGSGFDGRQSQRGTSGKPYLSLMVLVVFQWLL
jgi:hypothetical protein